MINWNFSEGFHPSTKVWIYQSSRELNRFEISELESLLKVFTKEWTSHKQELKATGTVLLNRFIVLLADESLNSVGGCSIDSSVKFIREIESHFNIRLLDRSALLFEVDGLIKEINLNQLEESIAEEIIKAESIYYNNTVTTLQAMKVNWKIPVKDSWIGSKFKNRIIIL